VRGQRHAPAAPYPRERPVTHCTGGWVGPRAGLDWCGKSRPTGIRSPDRPARVSDSTIENISCRLLHWMIVTNLPCSMYRGRRIHNPFPRRNHPLYKHFALPGRDDGITQRRCCCCDNRRKSRDWLCLIEENVQYTAFRSFKQHMQTEGYNLKMFTGTVHN